MKFSIFTPTSKVHAQRNVMREADERLAKYSKRGILLSVAIFSVCMLVGEYYPQSPKMTLVLTGGLLLITFARAYFLFKFDTLYAQAPTRWRNMFFFVSLIGSSWWGFIVANVTLVNGMAHETPILWLYTVAFFAGSLHVYAPFDRFFGIYMLVSFVPCSVIAISQLDAMSTLYGVIMLVLYLLLRRQGRIVGNNYWDKLQATYDLLKRANALEAEKITTESSLNSRDNLFNRVTHELKAAMQEIMGSLQLLKYAQLPSEEEQLVTLSEQKTQQQINLLKNVAELSNISSNKLVLDEHVVDLRYHIEQALSNVGAIAHKKNIELFSAFSADFPSRARVDVERLDQLIGNLVMSACQFSDNGGLLVNASYRFDASPAMLKISVVNPHPIRTPDAMENIADIFSPQYASNIHLGLSLSIVKGLTNGMGGNAGADYRDDGSLIFWANIQLEAMETTLNTNRALMHFSGKRVMLFRPAEMVSDIFQNSLDSWGLNTDIIHDEAEAIEKLESCHKHKPYQLIIICTRLDDLSALQLSAKLAEHPTLWSIGQIVTLSRQQNKLPEVEAHFSKYVNVEVLYKPVRYRRLQKMMKSLLAENNKGEQSQSKEDFLQGKRVLLFQQEDIDLAIVKAMLKKLGCQVSTALSIEDSLDALAENPVDVFITESHLENIDLKGFVDEARKINDALHQNGYQIPVLGYTSRELAGEESYCLASGMDYYIDSPTNVDDLRAILRRFLGRAMYMQQNQ